MPFHISEERIGSSLNTTGDIDFFHVENYKIRPLPHTMDEKKSGGIIVRRQPEPTRQAVHAPESRVGETRLTKHVRAQRITSESQIADIQTE